ncbi:uncharacterized protein Z518_11267 [Rhinocladiella mackenziei CBS 650.93]|uniref:CENP-V/GFA domain-containing protein n=1 Tax=Rhinocladiella mackenziei CBS 650.93 TaxID=1442369 RepID=A0A0D2I1F1_9EURO|nr:uncharacterized protein Z518_11267 [Rhinocladiella mackenziei CBS 650.93]KIW99528.1 hypothetical protein Z518_11267 [Rhinocladiella mackenziei CBS 650.93]
MATTGGCLCGEIKYEYTGDVALKGFCNCKDCQRWGGATGLPNVVVSRTAFKVTAGEPKTFDVVGGSGKINKHFFCGTCGSSLYCELEVMESMTCIKAGSLDEPDVKEMQVEFYVKDRVSYQKPQEGAKQVPAFG